MNEMEIFAAVVEAGSFSKAGERLNVSKSFISKKISKLEDELKVKLIQRSTRSLNLTEAGTLFYQHAKTILEGANAAYEAMADMQGKVKGRLRVTMAPGLARQLTAVITSLLAEHPELTISLETEQRQVDIVNEGFDLAFRSANLNDSNLIARQITSLTTSLVATPGYLAKHGTPKTPDDLTQHNCCTYTNNKRLQQLIFIKHDKPTLVEVNGNLVTNDSQVILQSVLSGTHMMMLPDYMIEDYLVSGELVRCLPDYHMAEHPLYAMYPDREYLPMKTKVFIETVKAYFSQQ
tara:strand:+ start:101630 stop:102505 length:876 start_codon:yes stop_codon:yes gene_type:complete